MNEAYVTANNRKNRAVKFVAYAKKLLNVILNIITYHL